MLINGTANVNGKDYNAKNIRLLSSLYLSLKSQGYVVWECEGFGTQNVTDNEGIHISCTAENALLIVLHNNIFRKHIGAEATRKPRNLDAAALRVTIIIAPTRCSVHGNCYC